jgi:triphosphoribosyl-dephospho-CoA synthase
LHLELMACCPDTLIARKCGAEFAIESAHRAEAVLRSVPDAGSVRDAEEFNHFDRWLRADGHRRNPGTTADLVTAALFAALREGAIGNVECRSPNSSFPHLNRIDNPVPTK